MEFLAIDINELYTTFICGVVLGFALSLVMNLLGGFIKLFLKIVKIGSE